MGSRGFSIILAFFICGSVISPVAFLPQSSSVSANPIEVGQPELENLTNEYRALQHISKSRGIPIEQLSIAAKNLINFQLTGRKVYSAKIFDGESFQEVYMDENGNIIDNVKMIEDEERKAVSQKYGKLEPDLFDLLQTMHPDELVSCAIWSKCAPLPSFNPAEYLSSEAVENAYSSYRKALENAYASAQKPVIDFLSANGFSVGYVSHSAPMISAMLPKWVLIKLQDIPEVDAIYLAREGKPCLDIAAKTVGAPSVWAEGVTGRGVPIAVVEVDELPPYPPSDGSRIAFANPHLENGKCFREDGPIGVHATKVAGIIASTHPQYRGIAYEAPALLSANAGGSGITWPYGPEYPLPINEATDWAVANDARVINNSWGYGPGTEIDDGVRYFDYVVKNSRITVVCAAGNENGPYGYGYSPDGVIVSPAAAYNVIAVGAIDDNGTESWQDDAMAEYSSWDEPAWLGGDREKPEVVAVGSRKPGTLANEEGKKYQTDDCWLCSTLTDSPWVGPVGCGTSFAAPAVTGAAALLMQENSSLQYQPEIVKAVLMASAVHNIEGDSRLSEYDGAGAIVIPIAYETVKQNRIASRIVDANVFPIEYKFQAKGGQRVRATIVWSVSYSVYGGLHFNDLDLTILDPNGAIVVSSSSLLNSFEIVDLRAPVSGTYTARITLSESWIGDESQYLGFAYSLVDLSTCLKYDLISFQDQLTTTFTGAEKILSGNVDPWTADNISIIPATSGPLRISFNGNDASEFMVRVILLKGGNVYGMRDLEFNVAQDGDYWIYQANYYDNIALVIARAGTGGTGGYTLRLENQYGYLSPPFKFSDVIDNGDASWAENYHVQLRISTNPSLDQLGGGNASAAEGDSNMTSSSIENSSPQVQTAGADEWVEVGRGRDYLTYRNPTTGEYKQVIYSGPIHTWDGSEWVSYVFENRGDYYQVQHPIASAKFYPDRTEFWDENFENRVVAAEGWAVERQNGEGWQGVDFSGATISHEILSEDEVRIVRTENSALGILKVTYIFTKGSPLKITSEFTPREDMTVRFAWRSSGISASGQRVERARLADLNPMKYLGAGEDVRAMGEVERDVSVSFFDCLEKPVVNFSWWEEAENENIQVEVEAAHENFFVHFGDFEVSAGRAVVLDPTVQINPNADAYVVNTTPDNNYGYYSSIFVGSEHPSSVIRSFLRFSLLGLPDGISITSSDLVLYVNSLMGSDVVEARKVGDGWTEGGLTWNNQPSYGSIVYTRFVDGVGYFGWHVDSYVRDEYNNQKDPVSFCMKTDTEPGSACIAFNSKQAASNHPYLEVAYTSFDFSVSVSPTSGSVQQGQSVQATVTVTLTSGTAQLVSLSASGLPSGASASFSPSSGYPTFTSTMTISTSATTPTGTYAVTISGTGGGLTRTAMYSLTINPGGPTPTTLIVNPSPFQVRSGENITFTATLTTSGGSPLGGKTITWSDNAGGIFSPSSGNTDSSGQVSTTYTAPKVNYSSIVARVTATFAGDAQYSSSSGSSTGTILPSNVRSAWVFWRFDNSDIDNVLGKCDGSSLMVGPENVTGIWSFDISGFSRDNIGSTIYWRVKARASDGRENWSPVYVGGRLMNPPDPVEVSISPDYQSGTPRMTLTYAVTIKNNDIDPDNFSLEVGDDLSWSLGISPNSFIVPPGENGVATLTVTIPENAAIGVEDEVTVTARSTENSAINSSASCIAHRAAAVFGLVTLYKVSLNVDIYLENGSKLVVKFYKYDNTYQAENVFWSGTTPAHVVKSDNVPHPRGAERWPWGTVQVAELVLTTDNENEVISTIASFTVHQSHLKDREKEILRLWPSHPELHDAFRAEIRDIMKQWSSAPP